MNVKTYAAPTIQAALALVKEDLGPNAFVLGTEHKTKKGLFGIGAKQVCEIRATADLSDGQPLAVSAKRLPAAPAAQAAKTSALSSRSALPPIDSEKRSSVFDSLLAGGELMDDYRELASYLPYGKLASGKREKKELPAEALADRLSLAEDGKARESHREWTKTLAAKGAGVSKTNAAAQVLSKLEAEIAQMADAIGSLANQKSPLDTPPAKKQRAIEPVEPELAVPQGGISEAAVENLPELSELAGLADSRSEENPAEPEGISGKTTIAVIAEEIAKEEEQPASSPVRTIRERLETIGLDPMVQELLLKPLGGAANERDTTEAIYQQALRRLSRLLKSAEPGEMFASHVRAVALIGPTGVGKTTTLAKLAARALLQYRRKVVLVTLDTYRIGAIKQLSTYADIISIPLKVAKSAAELEEAIAGSPSDALVLIDTAGRNPFKLGDMAELAAYFRNASHIQKHLLLSATTSEADNLQYAASFESFGVTNTIVTKIDETERHGSMVNVLLRAAKPLSFLTNGQNVPEDIDAGSPETIANLLFGRLRPQGE